MATIALIGNPNSGKTTLFNQLTGTTAHVGNWPGVTVEKKEGSCSIGGQDWSVVDLPGIYSLSPYSPEEQLSRRYILDSQPDLIVDVIDATNLERSLYLTTQLAELGRPLLLALNMQDLLKRDGVEIDMEQLSRMTTQVRWPGWKAWAAPPLWWLPPPRWGRLAICLCRRRVWIRIHLPPGWN